MSDYREAQNRSVRVFAGWLFAAAIVAVAIWIWHANGLPGLPVKDGIYACSGTDYRDVTHEYLGEIRDGEWHAWAQTTANESDLPDMMGLAQATPHRTSLVDENATDAATIDAGAVECHWVRGS